MNIIYLYRSLMVTLLVSMLSLSPLGQANAGETILWRGTTDLPSPCTRTETYTDDFGIEWPKLPPKFARQYLQGELYLVQTLDDALIGKLKACVVTGVKKAGLVAFIASAAGAWATFEMEFKTCAAKESVLDAMKDNLKWRVGTHCAW